MKGIMLPLPLLLGVSIAQSGETSNCNGQHGAVETDGNFCQTQDGPQCTFTFSCTEDPNDPQINGGISIFNGGCQCINSYDKYGDASSGDGSAFPFVIQTSNLSPPGLNNDVAVLYTDCSDPAQLRFNYANQVFDQSVCECVTNNDGLTGRRTCRCPFPCN